MTEIAVRTEEVRTAIVAVRSLNVLLLSRGSMTYRQVRSSGR
jgi:hypothetical protein